MAVPTDTQFMLWHYIKSDFAGTCELSEKEIYEQLSMSAVGMSQRDTDAWFITALRSSSLDQIAQK